MNIISAKDFNRAFGRGTNKYRNQRTSYNGSVYDSKREAEYRQHLDLLTGDNVPDQDRVELVEEQVRYPIIVNEVKICTYVLDFKVTYGDGRIEYVDVKGVKTGVYKLKKKLMKAVHGIDLLEV